MALLGWVVWNTCDASWLSVFTLGTYNWQGNGILGLCWAWLCDDLWYTYTLMYYWWLLLGTSSLHLMLGYLLYLKEVVVTIVWVRLRLWDTRVVRSLPTFTLGMICLSSPMFTLGTTWLWSSKSRYWLSKWLFGISSQMTFPLVVDRRWSCLRV